MQKTKHPLISVVITTKNDEKVLRKLLISLTNQTYKSVQIIVIDNNSSDNTKNIAKEFTKFVFNHGPERSAQRNYGANKATGEYLFFLDSDMELTPKVIEDCTNKSIQGKLDGIVVPEESKASHFWGKVKAFERSFYNEQGDSITDAARFFSKNVFFSVGRYDETITGPEDWDLPDRVREKGYKIGRGKEMIFHHEYTTSIVSLFKKKFYYGLNAHKYLVKHNIPTISPKTIYFLRPLFYKNWLKLVSEPMLSLAMIYMLSVELMAGGLGYLIGRIKNR